MSLRESRRAQERRERAQKAAREAAAKLEWPEWKRQVVRELMREVPGAEGMKIVPGVIPHREWTKVFMRPDCSVEEAAAVLRRWYYNEFHRPVRRG